MTVQTLAVRGFSVLLDFVLYRIAVFTTAFSPCMSPGPAPLHLSLLVPFKALHVPNPHVPLTSENLLPLLQEKYGGSREQIEKLYT